MANPLLTMEHMHLGLGHLVVALAHAGHLRMAAARYRAHGR